MNKEEKNLDQFMIGYADLMAQIDYHDDNFVLRSHLYMLQAIIVNMSTRKEDIRNLILAISGSLYDNLKFMEENFEELIKKTD